jgi:hypothetical protein
MIAPASPTDWLQGLTLTTLLAGVAIAFSRTLRLEEPTFDDGDDLSVLRGSVLVGPVDA